MKKQIALYGNPVLRKKASPITEITPEIKQLAADMFETMYDDNGIGLAGPQVGISLQIVTITIKPLNIKDLALINPEIIEASKDKEVAEEGCLSFPGITGEISRSVTIKVKGLNLENETIEFECSGLFARALQHEIDHLNAILFIDKMTPERRLILKKKLNKLEKEGKRQAP